MKMHIWIYFNIGKNFRQQTAHVFIEYLGFIIVRKLAAVEPMS